jgi:hypothetical protein
VAPELRTASVAFWLGGRCEIPLHVLSVVPDDQALLFLFASVIAALLASLLDLGRYIVEFGLSFDQINIRLNNCAKSPWWW